jgi:hypothetical protein
VQVLWVIAVFLLPAVVSSAILRIASLGSWRTPWLIVAVLAVLLALALLALSRATPKPGLTIAFDPATVQTPAALDEQDNKVADAKYFHFRVEVAGNVPDIEGRLIRIERENVAGGFTLVPEFKPPVHLTLDSVEG